MKKNMGTIDRVIRMALASLIAIFYLTGYLYGMLAVILANVAIVFFATSLVGFCPGYDFLGISTWSKNEA